MYKPFVFIASPYTKGDVAINVRFQMEMFDKLLSDGFVLPYAPLMSHFQHTCFPRPYEDWINYDLDILGKFDAVLRLDAVHGEYVQTESSGADGEVIRAKELGLPVFYRVSGLYEYVDTCRRVMACG